MIAYIYLYGKRTFTEVYFHFGKYFKRICTFTTNEHLLECGKLHLIPEKSREIQSTHYLSCKSGFLKPKMLISFELIK